MRLRTLLLLGFAIILGAAVARSLWVGRVFKQILGDYTQLVRTHDETLNAAGHVGRVAIDLETGVRGWTITHDVAFLEPYRRASRERVQTMNALAALVSGDAGQSALVARMGHEIDEWDELVARKMIAATVASDADRALAFEGKRRMDLIRNDLADLETTIVVSAARDADTFEQRRSQISTQDLVGSLVVLIALIALGVVLVRSVERPLDALAVHAGRGERPPPDLSGVAEVRSLSAAMSRMIGQLFAERERDRRFGELMASLAAGGTTREVSETALRSLLDDHGAFSGVLWIRREGGRLELAASIGVDREKLDEDGSSLAEESLRTNRTIRLAELSSEGAWRVRSACLEATPRMLVVAPITAAGVPIGAVELAGNELDPRQIESALQRIGLALQNTISGERTTQLVRELTEQRTRFRSVFESLTELVYLFDADGVCQISNPAADASIGGSAVGLTNDQIRVRSRAAMPDGSPVPQQASILEPRALRNTLRQIVDPTGKVHIVSMTTALLTGPNGRAGTVVSARDVTEEHELRERLALINEELRAQNEELRAQEEELRTQGQELVQRQTALALRNEQLTRATKHKSSFLATMSHELRTPLNAVIGFTDLLLDDPEHRLNEQQRGWVGDVNAAGMHLLTLINDILDLSRIEAGHVELALAPFDLADPVQAATALIRNLADQRQVQLEDRTQSGALMVHADRARVRQVLVNLISNAVKFTPSGGAVAIRAEIEPLRVRVLVADSGIGIDPSQAHRLFQPFSQLETGEHRRFGGTGLGLSISKQLVEKMGGEIGFNSTPGQGSTFWFTLPRPDTVSPIDAIKRSSRPSPPPTSSVNSVTKSAFSNAPMAISVETQALPQTTPGESRPTVLVVEDNGPDAEIMSALVSRAGYAVAHTSSAEEALRVIDSVSPSIVIADLGLPGMSGGAMMERIRAMPGREKIPIVVLTARDLGPTERERLGVATSHVIRKGALSRSAITDLLHELCPPMGIAVANDIAPKLGRLKVLIVDDNHMNRRVLRSMLQNFGCDVIEAPDGPTALELAANELPSLVLMDIQMPGMDGMATTKALQKNLVTKAIPVVAVTAHAMQGDAERFLDAGCVGYVSKPVARTALAAAVDRALGRSTWRQQG